MTSAAVAAGRRARLRRSRSGSPRRARWRRRRSRSSHAGRAAAAGGRRWCCSLVAAGRPGGLAVARRGAIPGAPRGHRLLVLASSTIRTPGRSPTRTATSRSRCWSTCSLAGRAVGHQASSSGSATRLGQGEEMPLMMDNGYTEDVGGQQVVHEAVSWPFEWYLRDCKRSATSARRCRRTSTCATIRSSW